MILRDMVLIDQWSCSELLFSPGLLVSVSFPLFWSPVLGSACSASDGMAHWPLLSGQVDLGLERHSSWILEHSSWPSLFFFCFLYSGRMGCLTSILFIPRQRERKLFLFFKNIKIAREVCVCERDGVGPHPL